MDSVGVSSSNSVAAGNFTVLHNFNPETEGFCSWSGLVEDKRGDLYGTTLFGGTFGYGTVFKLGNNGILTVLHSFGGVTPAK
jgi:uncharacterized repeat protein (TIGR03803 family)